MQGAYGEVSTELHPGDKPGPPLATRSPQLTSYTVTALGPPSLGWTRMTATVAHYRHTDVPYFAEQIQCTVSEI